MSTCPGCNTGGIMPHVGDCPLRPANTTYSGLKTTRTWGEETAAQPRALAEPYSEATSLHTAEFDSLAEAITAVDRTSFDRDPTDMEIDIRIYTTDRGYAVEIKTTTTKVG